MENVTCSNKKQNDRILCNQILVNEIVKRIKDKHNRCEIDYTGKNGNCGNNECVSNDERKVCDNKFILKYISGGLNGTTFSTTLKFNNKSYDMILKVQQISNETKMELNIIRRLSSMLKLNHHFIKYYHGFANPNMIKIFNNRDNKTKPIKNYEVLFIEKFQGDVESLFKTPNNRMYFVNSFETQKNFISQILISIFSLHNFTNCYHNDTHWGNFLYAINENLTQNSYFEYILNNKKYYLKKTQYKIVIWDFGRCQQIKQRNILHTIDPNYRNTSMMFHDYQWILHIIQETFCKKFNLQILNNHIERILNISHKYNNILVRMNNTSRIQNIENEFIKELMLNKLIFDTKPNNANIESTFYINLPKNQSSHSQRLAQQKNQQPKYTKFALA